MTPDGETPRIGQQVGSPIKRLTELAGERMRREFLLYCRRAWHIVEPKFPIWNWHMDAIGEHLVYVTQELIRNLMVLVPPRMTKSLECSVLWPTWEWLHRAEIQFLCASYNADLAIRDAVLSRRLIQSGWYQNFYGHEFYLHGDQNEKDRYANSKGGYRISTSVGGKSTGEGGDVQLLDDPHNAAKIESDTVRNNALAWHDNAWRSRMNDPNTTRKVYVGQRTHDADILGHVLRQEGERWTVLRLPMEYEPARKCITYANAGKGHDKSQPLFEDPRKVEGELLNPKRFNSDTTEREKEIMSKRAWAAQYQQEPEGAGGLILKRHWWRPWAWPEWHPKFKAGKERPLPNFFEVIQVYDTAFEEDEEADFTARTTWGLFYNEDPFDDPLTGKQRTDERVGALMLERYKDRPGFPELRTEALRSFEEWRPDRVLIEKKSSGHSLIQELRRKGVPARGVLVTGERSPVKYGDVSKSVQKRALIGRAHVASLMLEKGCIYYVPRNWAFDVINECVVENTSIMTRRGVVPVQDVCIGDEVLTHKGRWRPVTARSVREVARTVTVKTKVLGQVTLTPNHPVYASTVRSGSGPSCVGEWGWVNAGELVSRSYRSVQRSGGVEMQSDGRAHHRMMMPIPRRENPIDELDLRPWLTMASGKQLGWYEDDQVATDTHWRSGTLRYRQTLDYEFGYLLGLYVAEGSGTRYARYWSVNGRSERKVAGWIAETLRRRFGDVSVSVRDAGPCINAILHLPMLDQFWSEFGAGAAYKRLPAWVWDAPDEFLNGLLGGMLTGDGHVHELVGAITTVSETLQWQLRLLCARLGLQATCSIRPARKAVIINGRSVDCLPAYLVRFVLGAQYTVGIPVEDGIAYAVQSVIEAGQGRVYNFDVTEDHSYTTPAGVVHNCAAFPQGEHDDQVSSCVIAWQYMRRYYDLTLPDDDKQQDFDPFKWKRQERRYA